ncbi:MAG: hypothetical protein KC680_00500, partial [Candidatus Peregrinibacteria bacterium]|nr:hypothetical protein [Candidatus Peregrinibacteria bacterium]
GITAVAQLVRFFRRRNRDPWVRLPHRIHDGYGLKAHIVQEVIDAGVTLLITADTGIVALAEISLLKKQGIDTIVTDHHAPQEELPLAYAIIHPALSRHPLPHPCGAGVVYKLVHALEGAPWEDDRTDAALAMLGTIADLVELRGENRTLTIHGLSALNTLTSGPLSILRDHCCPKGDIHATDIAFRIAPRINAAGRMASPDIALRALLDGGESLTDLDMLNEQRQQLTRELCMRVTQEIDDTTVPPLLAFASLDFPHGILGLIAGKLTEQYGRPSLIAHSDGETCTASLRSTDAYNITLGLSRCRDLLLSYGGHAQAAGCTFARQNFDAIVATLSADIRTHVSLDSLVPTIDIDEELSPADITLAFIASLNRLEPFGQGNPEPLFVIRNVSLIQTRTCGQENTHLTGTIHGIKCVGFTFGQFAGMRDHVDIVARLDRSEWNGKTEPQLVIVDIGGLTINN